MTDSHADVRANRLYMFQQLFKEPEMTPEGKVKEDVKKFLKNLGPSCYYFMPMMMGYGRKGIPDFVGCYRGMYFAIETKRKGGKPTPWQERECAAINASYGHCFSAISSVEELQKRWEAYFPPNKQIHPPV